MAKKTITQLKEYFKVGKRPTENQFGDLIDSYVHVDASSEYTTYLNFPSDYQIGDYIEFLEFFPEMANASGLYEVSIAYTRGNIASAATHVGSVSHANPNIWRECGTVNKNNYVGDSNANGFTIDVNGYSRKFRIRATRILGVTNEIMSLVIKVRSINKNNAWNALNNKGNDPSSIRLQPMTNDWSLLVGDQSSSDSANVGLKVTKDAKLGVGTASPEAKLHVKETENLGNVNSVSALFDRNESAGGSTKIRLKYHASADMELNSGYSATGFRYGSYSDFNIINNGLYDSYAAINFVTGQMTRMNIAGNGNVAIGANASNSTQLLTVRGIQGYDEGGPTDGTKSKALLRLQSSNKGLGEVLDFGMNIWPSYGWIQPQNSEVADAFYDLSLNPKGGNVGIGVTEPEATLDVHFPGEPKTIKFLDKINTPSTMNSMLRFTWYNDTADVGVVRSGGQAIEALALRINQKEIARFTPNGNAAFQGKVEAKNFVVSNTPTADFVFASDYNLKPIQDVEKFISEKNHLPEIPSAKEMTENGVEIGEFQIKLLQKIEELTLYLISQNKEIENLKKAVNA